MNDGFSNAHKHNAGKILHGANAAAYALYFHPQENPCGGTSNAT